MQHMPLASLSLSCGGDWGEVGTNGTGLSRSRAWAWDACLPEEQGQVDLGDIHTGLEEIIARADRLKRYSFLPSCSTEKWNKKVREGKDWGDLKRELHVVRWNPLFLESIVKFGILAAIINIKLYKLTINYI